MNFKYLGLLAFALSFAQPALSLQPKSVIASDGYAKVVVSPKFDSAASKVDVLFVIDDSGSMDSHQRSLAQNAPAMASKMKSRGSLNVAVTTTAMCSTDKSKPEWCTQGKFMAPGVLKSDMPDFIDQLTKSFLVGTMGTAMEEMFSPVIAALTPPLSDNENKGFLRLDAALAVVILTDAEDQSELSAEDFVAKLEAIKGKGNFNVHGIIVPTVDTNCNRDGSGSNPLKIERAIELTGGMTHNICDANYAAILEKIGTVAEATMERTIRLPFTPIKGSIVVKYGNITLLAGDMYFGWVYDSKQNAVILGEAIDWKSMPAADIVVDFKY